MPVSSIDRPSALAQFGAILCGELPVAPDWEAIVALANRTLTTPALASALAARDRELPGELRDFLTEIRDRTRHRNQVMAGQLGELSEALWQEGARPVAMKGSALLAQRGPDALDRIMLDIDVMIGREKADTARKVMEQLGYEDVGPPSDAERGGVFERASDAASVDIHFAHKIALPCLGYDNLVAASRELDFAGGRILLPSAAAQAALLTAHDQLQEMGYWRGESELRYLIDLHGLMRDFGPRDWDRLAERFPGGTARRALELQIKACSDWLGALPALPDSLRGAWKRRRLRNLVEGELPSTAPGFSLVSAALEPPSGRFKRIVRGMIRPPKPAKESHVSLAGCSAPA